MPAKKLTMAQQRALLHAMTQAEKDHLVRSLIAHHSQTGGAFWDSVKAFFKKAGTTLAPILKEIGPTVLKEIVVPLVKSKMGSGMSLAGSGLKLAGQGKPRGRPRGRPKKTLTLK